MQEKTEVYLLLCVLHDCPFLQLFLLSASLAASLIADRIFSLHCYGLGGSRMCDGRSRNQPHRVVQARMVSLKLCNWSSRQKRGTCMPLGGCLGGP